MKSITIKLSEIELSVDYEYSYDPGIHTYPNGDPGYPPTEEIIINTIHSKDDLFLLLSNYKSDEIIDKIEEKISKYERTGSSD